eukprot:5182138-Pleurochrysis_carterae.AAC.1
MAAAMGRPARRARLESGATCLVTAPRNRNESRRTRAKVRCRCGPVIFCIAEWHHLRPENEPVRRSPKHTGVRSCAFRLSSRVCVYIYGERLCARAHVHLCAREPVNLVQLFVCMLKSANGRLQCESSSVCVCASM